MRFRRFIGGRQSDARLRRGTLSRAGTSGAEHLGKVLAAIDQELGLGRLPETAGIADALHVDHEEVADLIQARLGCTFRECRRALRLRRSLAVVAFGDEQYAQIAYRLGYEHPAQFTRDFGGTFGLSPSEFRALVAPPALPTI